MYASVFAAAVENRGSDSHHLGTWSMPRSKQTGATKFNSKKNVRKRRCPSVDHRRSVTLCHRLHDSTQQSAFCCRSSSHITHPILSNRTSRHRLVCGAHFILTSHSFPGKMLHAREIADPGSQPTVPTAPTLSPLHA